MDTLRNVIMFLAIMSVIFLLFIACGLFLIGQGIIFIAMLPCRALDALWRQLALDGDDLE